MSELLEAIRSLPKAELHLHIEGTLEPAMLMQLAEKHGVELPYSSVADVERAYDFDDLRGSKFENCPLSDHLSDQRENRIIKLFLVTSSQGFRVNRWRLPKGWLGVQRSTHFVWR